MHLRRDKQSIEIHRLVAERLRLEPELVIGKARANLSRWIEQRGCLPALLEWLELVNDCSPAELERQIVADDEHANKP